MPLVVMLEEFFPALEVSNIGICFDRANNGPIIPVEKVVADLQMALNGKKRPLN